MNKTLTEYIIIHLALRCSVFRWRKLSKLKIKGSASNTPNESPNHQKSKFNWKSSTAYWGLNTVRELTPIVAEIRLIRMPTMKIK